MASDDDDDDDDDEYMTSLWLLTSPLAVPSLCPLRPLRPWRCPLPPSCLPRAHGCGPRDSAGAVTELMAARFRE